MAEVFSTGFQKMIHDEVVSQMADGVIEIYSGTQPTNSEDTEVGAGTLLAVITESGGAFTGGSATNGLEIEVDGEECVIASGETWKTLLALATGTATWFRHYDNAFTKGASTTAVRYDGRVSTTGAEMNLSTTSIVINKPVEVSEFSYVYKKKA